MSRILLFIIGIFYFNSAFAFHIELIDLDDQIAATLSIDSLHELNSLCGPELFAELYGRACKYWWDHCPPLEVCLCWDKIYHGIKTAINDHTPQGCKRTKVEKVTIRLSKNPKDLVRGVKEGEPWLVLPRLSFQVTLR